MSNPKFYTVMELADRVGVPRTTINDWLGKYSTYIDFTMQGKRRIYSENTLSLLLNVSKMRSAGMPSFDIEKELAKTCAIHPETEVEPESTQPPPAQTPSLDSAPESSGEDVPPASAESIPARIPEPVSHTEEYALIAKQQTDEITALLGERFRDILSKMDNMEETTRKNTRHAKLLFALAVFVIVFLVAGGAFAWSFAMKMNAASVKKDSAIHSLSEQTRVLQNGSDAMKEHLEGLMKQLPEQQKEFDRVLKENRDQYEKLLASEKERFAAQQLVKAKELEAASKRADDSERLRKDAEKKQIRAEADAKRLAAEQKAAQDKILSDLAALRKQMEEAKKDRDAKRNEVKSDPASATQTKPDPKPESQPK